MKAFKFVFFALALFGGSAFACDVTLNPGTDVIASAVSVASTGDEICLNSGTYLESNTIVLKQGQMLRGLGTSIQDTKIIGDALYIIQFGTDSIVKHLRVEGGAIFYPPDTWTVPDVALLINYAPGATVWDVEVQLVKIPIHITSSDGAAVWNASISNGGGDVNWNPDPSIWIYDSDNVEILYGSYIGLSNGVGGDGEIACRDSNYLNISNVYVANSGAAGMYFVNCDNATVEDSYIQYGDEWGLDVVDGSSNFTATGNTIKFNNWGAVIFDETDNGSGTFTNNSFIWNNTSGDVNCQGIVVLGSVNNVTQSGNYSSNGPAICAY
jgi:hypothetical protein